MAAAAAIEVGDDDAEDDPVPFPAGVAAVGDVDGAELFAGEARKKGEEGVNT